MATAVWDEALGYGRSWMRSDGATDGSRLRDAVADVTDAGDATTHRAETPSGVAMRTGGFKFGSASPLAWNHRVKYQRAR